MSRGPVRPAARCLSFLGLPLLGLPLLGCADMLGLGELTFERAEDANTAASGGATGGSIASSGGGPDAAGGLTFGGGGRPASAPPSPADEYFKQVGRGAVIGATSLNPDGSTEGDSRAFVLEETGELLLLSLSEEAPDEVGHAFVDARWSSLLAPRFGEQIQLQGYQSTTGIISWGPVPLPGETWTPLQEAGSPGWSDLILVGDDDAPALVAFSAESGAYRIGPADLNLEDPDVSSGLWETTLHYTLPFFWEQPGVLRLAPDEAAGEFLPVSDLDFEPASEVSLPGWSWSEACLVPHDGSLYLLLYSALLGNVQRLLFRPDVGEFALDDEGLWRTGVDQLVPVQIGETPWLLLYDAESGVLDLKSPFDLDPESVVVK